MREKSTITKENAEELLTYSMLSGTVRTRGTLIRHTLLSLQRIAETSLRKGMLDIVTTTRLKKPYNTVIFSSKVSKSYIHCGHSVCSAGSLAFGSYQERGGETSQPEAPRRGRTSFQQTKTVVQVNAVEGQKGVWGRHWSEVPADGGRYSSSSWKAERTEEFRNRK